MMAPLVWTALALLLAAPQPAPTAGVRVVEIQTNSVDLIIQEGSLEQLEVYAGSAAAHGCVKEQGDRALVVPPEDARNVRVVLPPGRHVEIHTQSGDVEVHGSFELLSLRTVSGDISGTITARELLVKSMSGEVRLDVRVGRARIETVTGDIQASGQLEELQVKSTSGDVEVAGKLPRGMEAQTVSGNVELRGTMPEGVMYVIKSVSGDVTLQDTGAAGFRLKVRSNSGALAVPGGQEDGPGRLHLVRGNGRGNVEIQTLSGDINVPQ